LADDVPEEVKRRRNHEMLRVQNEISEEDNAELIGREFEVLVEGLSKSARKEASEEDDHHPQLVGRTRCDRIVVFDGNPRLVGNIARVHIFDCTPTTLIGSIVTRDHQHGDSSLLPILA
jgi:tRNA-2-methylthio-N6-dimethylallyladenosine synthase